MENDRARKRRKREKVDNVGNYVRKEFDGYGVFIGKVISFSEGLYRVDYEDGDFEDLEAHEVAVILVKESDFDEDYKTRRKKLDELIRKKHVVDESAGKLNANSEVKGLNEAKSVAKLRSNVDENVPVEKMDIDEVEGLQIPCVDDVDADSSSDSSEFVQVRDSASEAQVPIVPPPELPSSSGNICVPEESVSHLFSVYSVLRSFSIQLYLCPFKLDDFVGSLNCRTSNTLMDAVHFSLLRALKNHLEIISSDGSKLASKCLRRLDWSLLDTLTWPVYLVEYLVVMGYAKGPEWQGFYTDVLHEEYYSISVDKKLTILQILCDDVMESAELRAVIDVRENLEEGSDTNGAANSLPHMNGLRTVQPKNSKTSDSKDLEAINSKAYNSNSTHATNLSSVVPAQDTDISDADPDENSDECQLCGMDGTLLCCDGCPSAYHSRCIGLNKMLIPDGLWFCPECTAKQTEPTLRISAGLRGAEVLGIDPYGQIFLGICNHLLVLDVSGVVGPSPRYYSETDVAKVLKILCSSEQHKTLYSGICKSMLQYWKTLEGSIVSLPEKNEIENNTITCTKEDTKAAVPIHTPDKLRTVAEDGHCASSVTTSNVENGISSGQENSCQEVQVKNISLEAVNEDNHPISQRDDCISAAKPFPVTDIKNHEQFGTESFLSSGSCSHYPGCSDLTQQSGAEKSNGMDLDTCANGDTDKEVIDNVLLVTKGDIMSLSSEQVENKNDVGGTNVGHKSDGSLYMGGLFKPQSYINQYSLGDVAASAAANFSVVASEGKGITYPHTSSNPRKVVSENIALQLKAFLSASIRFIWPTPEKKVMEVPRERCGWCLSCKGLISKRGCLLNLAASNAMKGSARNIAALRTIKNREGNISGIIAYILYMEESLRGLLVGPFLSSSYRKHWRKELEEASTCSELKSSLLELEENIRPVAFSSDWVKMVDDWMVESSAAQNTSSSVGAPQKKPGGRRTRKQAAISEVAADPGDDNLRIIKWWRGGKLSKLVFQKGILPCSIIKKAARQGGRRKISGTYYPEGSEIPKRSRRFTWRAAVEMSKNAPQLALQVRYLDLHLKWSDIVLLEQNSYDGKGTDAETSTYRNALICDKNLQENKIKYALIFNQKHLPSRVMKNTVDMEQNEDGEERFWFSEAHVPLFLIKEYEQKVEKDQRLPTKPLRMLSKLQRRQLKAFRRNIFLYLMNKEERVDKCPCASCKGDLLLGDAIKCNECEGYCHQDCISRSTIDLKDEVDYVVRCKQCYRAKPIVINENINNINKTPSSQLFNKRQESKMAVAATNDTTIPGRKRNKTCGIIWKKKYCEENGTAFRMSNILLRGNVNIDPSKIPICYLCLKPYDADLMYICCEDCQLWYHADAVQLNESQIFDVVGFKCSRCRRTRMPGCPYADPDSRKSRFRDLKQINIVTESGSESMPKSLIGWEVSTPESSEKLEGSIDEDDPLLFSLERVEPVPEFACNFNADWDTTGPLFQAPQKLPVRRHVKLENGPANQKLPVRKKSKKTDGLNDNAFDNDVNFDDMKFEPSTCFSENASPPQAEWEFPIDDCVEGEMFDYESVDFHEMEFEPQTYFSFTELLATDDNQSNLCDGSVDMRGDWVNSAVCEAPPYDNLPEQPGMSVEIDHEELNAKVEPDVKMSCRLCSHTEPEPDLFCEVCGLWMHYECSPWVESTRSESWRCGNCRDWA